MSEPVSEPEKPGSEQPAGEHSDSEQPDVERPDEAKSGPESLSFRILPIALIAVLTLAVCMTPVAFAHPAGLVILLIPLGLAVWILRAKTVVTPEKITARMLRRTEIDWDDVRQLRVDERRWLRAVLSSGQEVLLPAVRLRDLPRIAAMSGGRIPDPTAAGRADEAERGGTSAEAAPTDPTPDADEAPDAEGTPRAEGTPDDDSEGTSESGQDARDQR